MSTSILVLDASVWINLLATGKMREILRAIPERKVIVHAAAGEVVRDPLNPRDKEPPLAQYLAEEILWSQALVDEMHDTFLSLVNASPPNDLGDGEAATLAHAKHTGSIAVIDERKARRIAVEQLKGIQLLSTVDLLRRPEVVSSLDSDLPQAIFSALTFARMRVLPIHRIWVSTLIGPDRAGQCPSLGRNL